MASPDSQCLNILEVDRAAVAENMRAVRQLVGIGRTIFAVVKADAYGLGAIGLADTLIANGADAIGMEDLALALRLREHGITEPILLYPCALPAAAADVIANELTPVIDDMEWASALSGIATQTCDLFVRIDVAHSGLGVAPRDALAFLKTVVTLPNLHLAGLCAHTPSSASEEQSLEQLTRFNSVIEAAATEGIEVPLRLLAASSLVLRDRQTYLNAVDPGRMLYGIVAPSESPVPLRRAFKTLKTRLIAVHELKAEMSKRTECSKVGLVPIGSADGLDLLHAGRMLVRGCAAPLLGKPALEHSRLDLSGVPSAGVGDEVVIIGRQGQATISPDDVAEAGGAKPARLAITVGPRVTRIYV